ncbi:restriction system modified-DNA reader domain-containing protein [Actinomyces howellii]|uniref:RAMA domain-containing protein n=1 Tax=Actinomyces howellii TaxID=52771 RepID=A0A3S4RFE3_9ACTO|nr:hypothetical protein [Actinomyces howellii]VEG27964.1 Uncharacterised protein [Actinomyces howellii]
MTIFELKGTRLVPASLGSAAGAPERGAALRAAGGQLVDVLRRPLLTVAHDRVEGGESLIALDPTGQVVTVEVLDRLTPERLQAAMSRAGTNVAGGRGALGLRYTGGSSALRRDLEVLRESAPSQVASPRLVVLAASVLEEMRASLLVLAGSAVEVHELSVRSAGDGRVFVTVTPLSPESLSEAGEAEGSATRRRSRSADAAALSPARTDSERIEPRASGGSWAGSLGSTSTTGTTSTTSTVGSAGSAGSRRRSDGALAASGGPDRGWSSDPGVSTSSYAARSEQGTVESRWSERSWSEPARPDPARPEPSRPEPGRPEPSRPEPARPESSWSERGWSEPARTSSGASSWSSGPAQTSSSFSSAQRGLDAVTVNTTSLVELAPTQPDIQGAVSRMSAAANHRASARVLGATPTVPAGDEGEAALAYLAATVDTPVTLVWHRARRGIHHEAVLRSDGSIRLADGTVYRDPSVAANAAQHTQDVDGWRVWRLGANGPNLAEVLDALATA